VFFFVQGRCDSVGSVNWGYWFDHNKKNEKVCDQTIYFDIVLWICMFILLLILIIVLKLKCRWKKDDAVLDHVKEGMQNLLSFSVVFCFVIYYHGSFRHRFVYHFDKFK